MSDLTPREAARAAHRAPAEPDQASAASLDLEPEVEQAWLRPRGRNRYPGAAPWTASPPSRADDPADATDTATSVEPVSSPRAASSAVSRRSFDPFRPDEPRSRGRRASPTINPEALAAERLASDRATIAAQGEALRRVAQSRIERHRAAHTASAPSPTVLPAPSPESEAVRPTSEAVRPRASFNGEVQHVPQPTATAETAAAQPATAAAREAAAPGRRLIAGGVYSEPLRAPEAGAGLAGDEGVPVVPGVPASERDSSHVDVATRAITVVREAARTPIPAASARTLIMGILNVTLDSFSDGGRYARFDDAIAHARSLVADGADIIDVGGESTRPGAPRVEVHEEQRRVVPVIRELVALGCRVSIDTMNAATAFAAVSAGADIINDVSGGLADPNMAQVVVDTDRTYVAMHWRGHSDVMNSRATYANAVAEVKAELFQRVAELVVRGVEPDRIVIDPGLGFAKLAEHNWQLLGHLRELSEIGLPILVAASRKRFLGGLLPEEADVHERDPATAVISALSAQAGAWGVRVHDVASTRAALDVWQAWQKGSRG